MMAFHHGDPESVEAEAWALLEAEARVATLGFYDGLAKAARRR